MTDCKQKYERIRWGDGSWIDTHENAVRFICARLRDRDDDYEVTPVTMTPERFESLPEFTGP